MDDNHNVSSAVGGRAAAMSLDMGELESNMQNESMLTRLGKGTTSDGNEPGLSSQIETVTLPNTSRINTNDTDSFEQSKSSQNPNAPGLSNEVASYDAAAAGPQNNPDNQSQSAAANSTATHNVVATDPPKELADDTVSDRGSVASLEEDNITVSEARTITLQSSSKYIQSHFPQLKEAVATRVQRLEANRNESEKLMQEINTSIEHDEAQGANRNTQIRSATGYVFDERCIRHRHPTQNHPECPERVMSIVQALRLCGLESQMKLLPAREATVEELRLVHSQQHVERVFSMRDTQVREQMHEELAHNSAFANEHTVEASLVSAGGTLALVKAVCDGSVRNGVAVLRPPGHHAECSTIMGFCVFNNVAIAASWIVNSAPRFNQSRKNRVLIVDWDVHHGNGTQHMFESDPNVMYISIHRWDYGHFFPPGPDGGPECVGVGAGTGKNINVAWNGPGPFGDSEYLAAWSHVVMPAARAFAPDVVLVSAGFDAASGDPLGGCYVNPAGYGHMLHQLSAVANGRIIVSLEGGYNLRALAECSLVCCAVLLGAPPPELGTLRPPCSSAMFSISKTVGVHNQIFASGRVPGDHFENWAAFSTVSPSDLAAVSHALHPTRHQNFGASSNPHTSLANHPSGSDASGHHLPFHSSSGGSHSQQHGGTSAAVFGRIDSSGSLTNPMQHNVAAVAARSISAPVPQNSCGNQNNFHFPASPGFLFPSRSTTPTGLEPSLILPGGFLGPRPASTNPPAIHSQATALEDYMQTALNTAAGNFNTPIAFHAPKALGGQRPDTGSFQHAMDVQQEEVQQHRSRDLDNPSSRSGFTNVYSGMQFAESPQQREQTDAEMQLGAQGAAVSDHDGFQIYPLRKSPHVPSHVNTVDFRENSINIHSKCASCDSPKECWACLKCFGVFCGRHVNQHMLLHSQTTGHLVVISFADLSVWDYGLERYLDGLVIPSLKPIVNALHRQKFHTDASFPAEQADDTPLLEMETTGTCEAFGTTGTAQQASTETNTSLVRTEPMETSASTNQFASGAASTKVGSENVTAQVRLNQPESMNNSTA